MSVTCFRVIRVEEFFALPNCVVAALELPVQERQIVAGGCVIGKALKRLGVDVDSAADRIVEVRVVVRLA